MSVRTTLDDLTQDLRYAARTLRRDAGFTAFAILIVGLGIGASVTVFSIANALLLRPLPFDAPDRLVWIANGFGNGLSSQTIQVDYQLAIAEQAHTLSDVAGYMAFYGVGDMKLTGQGEPERYSAVPVSQKFFPLLGVRPIIGRSFNDEESRWNGPKAVMLSHSIWTRRFASDSSLVGRALVLNDEPVTVVGVLPESFDFGSIFAPGSRLDFFTPFPLSPETNRWGNTMAIVARLKPGETVKSASTELGVLGPQMAAARPNMNGFRPRLTSLRDHVSGRVQAAMYVLAGAVGVVMLIVCANLSNLLLVRATTRQKEMAIRAALGAARTRLVRQMLTESVLLSVCGAAVGLLLAIAGTRAVTHLNAVSIPLLENVRVDAPALGVTLVLALAAGLAFGLAPALQHPVSAMHDALKDSGRGTTEGKRGQWMRSSLVVSEIALACVLLVGSGLLLRSFLKVLDVDMGFRPSMVAALRVDADKATQDSQPRMNAYIDDVMSRARAIRGVEAVALTDALPLGRNRSWGAPAKGAVYAKGEMPVAFVRLVSDGYPNAMGIRLIAGRDISKDDTPATEPVIMINETAAKRLWPGEDAVGKYMRVNGDRRVVGVVGDVRHLALEQGAGMEMYLPMRQNLDQSSVDLVVRTSLPPTALAASIREALKPIAPSLPTKEFRTLTAIVDKAVSPRRFFASLLGGFAIFALGLALLGIYGVISYTVKRRTQEIGVRMALGASAANVQGRIIRETLTLAAIGMALGTVASWALARSLSGFLFGVTATDPVTFLGMLAVLTLVAVIGGYLPARRASRIDPMEALRAS